MRGMETRNGLRICWDSILLGTGTSWNCNPTPTRWVICKYNAIKDSLPSLFRYIVRVCT
jgi:hypothetical protein